MAGATCDERLSKVLLDRGADPRIRDGLFDSTPAGWDEHCESPEALELLVSVADG